MKLLYITPMLPSPPTSGAPRRNDGLMTTLARSHSVSLIAQVAPGEDHRRAIEASRTYCDRVMTVPNHRYGVSAQAKRRLQLRSMATPFSYERLVYHNPAFQRALDQELSRDRYDVVVTESSLMSHYRLRTAPGTIRLLDEHNIEYDILRRTAHADVDLSRKLYSYVNYFKARREERAAWRAADGVTVTSARDEQVIHRHLPSLPTAVVPNAVNTDFFTPGERPPKRDTILFFGALNYYPNIRGVLFLLDEVMPRLRQRHPEVRLVIVGGSPPESILARRSERVIVTGLVDDVRPHIRDASVVVVPLFIGGGTRLKIVEAMSMGKAIVSTRLGAEGIDVTAGRDILLADDADAFAGEVGRLLDDPALSSSLGAAARRLAINRYDWRQSVERLERLCEALLTPRPTPTATMLVRRDAE